MVIAIFLCSAVWWCWGKSIKMGRKWAKWRKVKLLASLRHNCHHRHCHIVTVREWWYDEEEFIFWTCLRPPPPPPTTKFRERQFLCHQHLKIILDEDIFVAISFQLPHECTFYPFLTLNSKNKWTKSLANSIYVQKSS